MRAFFELLRIAYEFRGSEFYYIHDRVIELLRDLLTDLRFLKRIEPETEAELGEWGQEGSKERIPNIPSIVNPLPSQHPSVGN
ncbi:hypothetical protein EV122DRAFT_275479 [Schizophyllum commune]